MRRRPIMRWASASPCERVQPFDSTTCSAPRLRPARTSATARVVNSRTLKERAVFELLIAGLNLVPRQIAETVDAELLAAEASHHAAVDHRAAKLGHIGRAASGFDSLARQIPHEAAGEAIARAGGVEDLVEQVTGRHKVAVAMEQNGPVFAALDDQRFGA